MKRLCEAAHEDPFLLAGIGFVLGMVVMGLLGFSAQEPSSVQAQEVAVK